MDTQTIPLYKTSRYKILEKLGEGGMGVVYKAQDLRLDRLVALKFLPRQFGVEEEEKKRFIHEAKAASALDHPNICTIHEIDQTEDGQLFIAMAYYEGETLKQKIQRGPLPAREAADIALQVAQGLAKAHTQGLVHRDIKPANVILTTDGIAKILDFGLAKSTSSTELTKTGTTLGTAAYMSPEQAQGRRVDPRADVWSVGVVLYEMLSGRRPFRGEHLPGILFSIVNEEPAPLHQLRPDAPPELERAVARALEKDRERRYPSAAELAKDLADYRAGLTTIQTRVFDPQALWREGRRPRVAVPALLLLLAIAGGAGWLGRRVMQGRWAREQAIPEISRLIEAEKYPAALALARQAERYMPADHPLLVKLWPAMSRVISVQTTPPGADIYIKDYSAVDAPWEYVGRTPLEQAQLPLGFFRWKIEKKGFATLERGGRVFPVPFPTASLAFTLDQEASVPVEMVRAAGADRYALAIPGFEGLKSVQFGDYWVDRYEVTNKQYKEFVDRGGYQKREYWKQPFLKEARDLPWEQAIAAFRDTTGRPGPAAWEQGDYPRGQDEYPVTGVSWYEAAAYAEFAGKSLPTIYHWNKAAGTTAAFAIVPLSNFGGQGPAQVGSYRGMSASGAYDMAGNVKEWCWNAGGEGKRYILGGAWNEPNYMFIDADAQSPFSRSSMYGFRCVKYISAEAVSKNAAEPVLSPKRDYSREKPVSDELFRVYKSMYSYDKAPLSPVVEAVDDSDESWKKERITFAAAYGNERVLAYLFLPKKFSPPYQTVVFFPGSNAIHTRSSKEMNFQQIDFFMKSGRAVLHPIYKGTYERGDGLDSDYPDTTNSYRDHVIAWSKDLGRSIDYLEARPEIDRSKMGYYGFSWGGALGVILPAVESRLKLVVLGVGGFCFQKALPEVDQINFVSRVTAPTLMLNGRYDFFFPVETAQVPMFRLLGAPQEHKRHVIYETGHAIPRNELIKETLDWLDRYWGAAK